MPGRFIPNAAAIARNAIGFAGSNGGTSPKSGLNGGMFGMGANVGACAFSAAARPFFPPLRDVCFMGLSLPVSRLECRSEPSRAWLVSRSFCLRFRDLWPCSCCAFEAGEGPVGRSGKRCLPFVARAAAGPFGACRGAVFNACNGCGRYSEVDDPTIEGMGAGDSVAAFSVVRGA